MRATAGRNGRRGARGAGHAGATLAHALALVMVLVMGAIGVVGGEELTPAVVMSATGDGADGKGNTEDDRWQFWFELAHAPGSYQRLSRHTSTIPAAGIPGKVRGPVGGLLPNPAESAGWVLHTDWDGRFEGVWGDRKAREILVHPYVEKTAHQAVAITYTIPEDGVYVILAGLTDVQVNPDNAKHDGITWKLEVVNEAADKTVELARGAPIGDGQGRRDSARIKTRKTRMRKGYLVRLVIHPNKWWGQDLTRVDTFRVLKE